MWSPTHVLAELAVHNEGDLFLRLGDVHLRGDGHPAARRHRIHAKGRVPLAINTHLVHLEHVHLSRPRHTRGPAAAHSHGGFPHSVIKLHVIRIADDAMPRSSSLERPSQLSACS